MIKQIDARLLKAEPMQRCTLGKCFAACCLHGVWIDRLEADDLLENAGLIKPHLPEELQSPSLWFDGRVEADKHSISGEVLHSSVLPSEDHYGATACVFLRKDHKCALQVAGTEASLHPWRFKPFYCILHPLDLDENGLITIDETKLLLDEPASCLRTSEKHIPLIITFEAELRYLVGNRAYERLLNEIEPH
ncbi:MAG: hypothetical protein MUO76_02630 [Anaerolineaceae bacterium]|nr:hypothetical protein [Anaerolineaceae bacterium]